MTVAISPKTFSPEQARADFPLLATKMNGRPLVYLDNAASAQQPAFVLAAVQQYFQKNHANVHRSAHELSARATDAFEGARKAVQHFIGAPEKETVLFTKGTTESINLVASSYGNANIQAGDEILLTEMEHHSNIVPWQLLAQRTGAIIRVVPVQPDGDLNLAAFDQLLSAKTRIFALAHISNALGSVNPVAELIQKAHKVGAVVLVDGAQAVMHQSVDVQALDCDFYAFSGHKMMAPTGIGILYGKRALLEAMPPYQGGGEMIEKVSFEGSTWNTLPYKFEAGTPNIGGAVGLGAAISYLHNMDRVAALEHENNLLQLAASGLSKLSDIRLLGQPAQRSGVVSFIPTKGHAHDIGTLLSEQGIAIRTGHHCAMPLMNALKVSATARASFAFYNTKADVSRLLEAVARACELF